MFFSISIILCLIPKFETLKSPNPQLSWCRLCAFIAAQHCRDVHRRTKPCTGMSREGILVQEKAWPWTVRQRPDAGCPNDHQDERSRVWQATQLLHTIAGQHWQHWQDRTTRYFSFKSTSRKWHERFPCQRKSCREKTRNVSYLKDMVQHFWTFVDECLQCTRGLVAGSYKALWKPTPSPMEAPGSEGGRRGIGGRHWKEGQHDDTTKKQ